MKEATFRTIILRQKSGTSPFPSPPADFGFPGVSHTDGGGRGEGIADR
jgi:hypothetical protein